VTGGLERTGKPVENIKNKKKSHKFLEVTLKITVAHDR